MHGEILTPSVSRINLSPCMIDNINNPKQLNSPTEQSEIMSIHFDVYPKQESECHIVGMRHYTKSSTK